MADINDRLIAKDGLSNAKIRYAGLDTNVSNGGANHRFELFDERKDFVGTFNIDTYASGSGSIDDMVLDAHRQMTDVLRQLLFEVAALLQHLER